MGKMLNDRPRNRYPSSASLPPTALCQQTKRKEIEQHAERTFKFKLQVNEEQGNAKSQKAQGTRTDRQIQSPKPAPDPRAAELAFCLSDFCPSGFCCKSIQEHHRPLKVSNSIA